jgi:hypothetical protein
MRSNSGRKPQPPKHGQVRVASMKFSHAKDHLRMISDSAAEVKDYGGHSATADARGGFAPGGAAGSDYSTASVNDSPDADFSGTAQ